MTLVEALRLAFEHYRSGRLDAAADVCAAVLRAVPGQPEALQILGAVESARGRNEEAARRLAGAAIMKPDAPDLWSNLGVTHQNLGGAILAERLQSRALRIAPGNVEAWVNRGSARLGLGDREGAEADFRTALGLRPDDAQAATNLGVALREMGKPRASAAAHRRALSLQPGRADFYRDLGHILREAGALAEARDAYGRAYTLNAAMTEALSYCLFTKQAICDWSDYDAQCRAIARIIDDDRGIVLPLAILSIDHTSAAQQRRAAERFFRTVIRSGPLPPWTPPARPRAPGSRLRVAYFSADFHEHATAYLAAEMFELHDRQRFEVLAYSYGVDDASPMRRRLVGAFDRFRDIRGVGAEAVSAMVAADGVDILVDLKGYTKQSRMELLRRRLAPVQATYLGYPGTLGADTIDYTIGDRFVTPLEHADRFTEALAILPDSYQVNDRNRTIAEPGPTRAQCGLPEGAFVFCAFNTTYKITPPMFGVWMRLLAAVPGSVLWLFEANAVVTGNLRREAAARGVEPGRLVFAPKRPLADHLARYRLADLFLDTLPYTGHTTTSDALWAGLPGVTCLGDTFAARVAAGLLAAAGLPELITTSLAGYEALALALARQPERLAGLRRRLEDGRLSVPLFDSRRFTRHIESAYETMWAIHEAGEPPRSFEVAALPSPAAA